MKIRLLNDGDYGDMDDVRFPVEVEGTCARGKVYCEVKGVELLKAGASHVSRWDASYPYVFILGDECEVLS